MKTEPKTIAQRVADLIDLKSIVTVAVIGGMIWGFVAGKIPAEAYIAVASTIITFYFTKRRNADGSTDDSEEEGEAE